MFRPPLQKEILGHLMTFRFGAGLAALVALLRYDSKQLEMRIG